jgi:hypothetical protein
MKHNYYLTHFALHECVSPRIHPAIWAEALAYLKKTGDVDGWSVILYGA